MVQSTRINRNVSSWPVNQRGPVKNEKTIIYLTVKALIEPSPRALCFFVVKNQKMDDFIAAEFARGCPVLQGEGKNVEVRKIDKN